MRTRLILMVPHFRSTRNLRYTIIINATFITPFININPLETEDFDGQFDTVICSSISNEEGFSSNFETNTSELLVNIEEMIP